VEFGSFVAKPEVFAILVLASGKSTEVLYSFWDGLEEESLANSSAMVRNGLLHQIDPW